jgi:cytidylate kinase
MAARTAVKPSVAIDGPAGVGKGTTAKRVAAILGVPYLDTGSIYRAAALACREAGVDLADPVACGGVIAAARFVFENGVARAVNGFDVRSELRGLFATDYSSRVSAHSPVRAALLELQRSFVRETGGVVEGRDIGTVVLPDATCKVFLTASEEVRTMRRAGADGRHDAKTLAAEIRLRDYRDSHRADAPLRAADDAVVVDNSNLTVEQTAEIIVNLVATRLPA